MIGKRLTSKMVESLRPPAKGYVIAWDNLLPGFGIRVTARGSKSFVVQTKVGRSARRVTIGTHRELGAEDARERYEKSSGAPRLATELCTGTTVPTLRERIEQGRRRRSSRRAGDR